MDEIEDEEPWLLARAAYLHMVIPLVANPRAEASLKKLAATMQKRLAALEHRRLHPLEHDEPPGG
jgi:hypothetical protein